MSLTDILFQTQISRCIETNAHPINLLSFSHFGICLPEPVAVRGDGSAASMERCEDDSEPCIAAGGGISTAWAKTNGASGAG